MITRKTYRTIAQEIVKLNHPDFPHKNDKLRWLAKSLCIEFRRDNPRFDRRRFLTACGFDPDL
jgi:hypothetical protein